MNTLDLLIVIVLAGGLALGFRSGLIKQAVGFAGLVLAFVLSLHLMQAVGGMLTDSLGISKDIAPLVGFVLVFLLVEVAAFAVVRLVEALVGALRLTTVNRFLGGAVGAFKAAIVMSVVFLVLGKLQVPSEQTRQASALYAPVSTVLPTAWDYVTAAFPQFESLAERFGDGIEARLPTTGEVQTDAE